MFRVSGDWTFGTGATLAPQGSCTFGVTFSPALTKAHANGAAILPLGAGLRVTDAGGLKYDHAAGDAVLAPSVTRRLLDRFARLPSLDQQPPSDLSSLTSREREILGLLGHGLSNAEIAATLTVSEATVKTHVGHVLEKLKLRDRVQAVIYTYESGLITPAAHRPPSIGGGQPD